MHQTQVECATSIVTDDLIVCAFQANASFHSQRHIRSVIHAMISNGVKVSGKTVLGCNCSHYQAQNGRERESLKS